MAKGSSQWKKDMEAKPSSILSASTADPGAPWIQVSTPDNKLTLENVYLNGLHALHRLLIRNTTGFPLTVKLRSNLGPQMAFQLTNENLPDSKPSPSHGKGQGQLMRGDSMANFVQWLSMDSSLDSLSRPVMTSEPLSLDDGHSDSSSSSNLGCSMEDSSLGQQSTNAELWSQMLSAPPVTTNTVSAAIVNSNKESKLHGHHFNQLFNYVNYTDEIKLGPMEISSLILAFLPDEKLRSRRYKRMVSEGMSVSANTGSINSDGKDEQKDKGSDFNDDGQSFDFFEINGLLFFFAYKDVAPLSAVLESSSLPSGIPSEAVMRSEASTKEMHPQLPLSDIIPLSRALSISMIRDASGSSRTHPSSQVHSVSDSVTSSPLHNGSKEKDDPTPDFQLTVKFRSKVCKSVFWSDMGGSGLNFDDCVVGGTYFKDFTLWNRSEIDLYFILNTVDLSNGSSQYQLKFCDYDSGEVLDDYHIPPYSPLRIRIIFKPLDVGEFNYDLQIENANDSGNNIQAHIHAMVRSVQKEESLVVSSGSLLDFGDCCAGIFSKQKLVLKNVSDTILDVVFASDEPSLIFQLKTDDLDGNGTASGLNLEKNDQLLLDRLHELSSMESITPDFSGPVSLVSSRPSSPMSTARKDTDLLSAPGSLSTLDISMTSSDSSLLKIDPADFAKVLRKGENDYIRVEEIQLRPGTERTIEVIYRPEKDSANFDYLSGRLLSKSFRITLKYSPSGKQREKERKVIQCKARSCTSVIDVSPKELLFGDTDVGTLKSLPIKITNCSELPAKVEVRFVSKVLTCYRGELTVPAKQSIEVKIDIYPRKVNADYRKQITVANLLNRDNDQTVQVFATNIDKYRITYHSFFYRLLTPSSTNFIDFGSIAINSPVVRSFVVENVTSSRLLLEFCATLTNEVVLYEKVSAVTLNDIPTGSQLQHRKERLLQSIEVKRKIVRAPLDTSQVPSPSLRAAQLGSNSNFFRPRSHTDSSASEVVGSEYLDLAAGPSARDILKSGKRRLISSIRTESQSSDVPRESRPSSSTRKTMEQRLLSNRIPKSHVSPPTLSLESSSSNIELANTVLSPGGIDDLKDISHSDLVGLLEQSKVSVDRVLSMLERDSSYPGSVFLKNASEDRVVRAKILLLRELRRAIEDGRLRHVSILEIKPEAQKSVYVVYTPTGADKPYIQGKPKKQDSRVLIHLKEYDKSLSVSSEGPDTISETDIPVRELLLRSSVCRSILELGQKNINFGVVDKHEKRTKKILIRNNSEFPALYAIKKSGSIASGDLIMTNSKTGVIRAFGKREVEFIFDPSLSGPFHEQLTVENVNDPTNNQVIVIKATVKRATHFYIEKMSVDFGVCMINEACQAVQKIVVSNTNLKHIRVVDVSFNPDELHLSDIRGEIFFDMLEDDDVESVSKTNGIGKQKARKRPMMIMTREIEEQIEHLEQKLKIARRKGRKDKLKKISDKIMRLKSGFVGEDYENEPEEGGIEDASFDTTAKRQSDVAQRSDSGTGTAFIRTKKTKTSVSFALHPRSCRTVLVTFRPTEIDKIIVPGQPTERSFTETTKEPLAFTGNIYVQEHKNTDIVKKVVFQSTVCFDHASYLDSLSSRVEQAPRDVADDARIQAVRASVPNRSVDLFKAPPAEAIPTVSVELSTIDLGKIEINSIRECYFTLKNFSHEEQGFEILEPQKSSSIVFNFRELSGTLVPEEVRRVYLTLSPLVKGRQTPAFSVSATSDGSRMPVTFNFFGISSRYLQFQTLDLSPVSEIDFGYCCIDFNKKFTKSLPVRVVNISDDSLIINVSSNLAQQCSLFLEQSLKNAVSDLFMAPLESKVIYIAIQPYVNPPATSLVKKQTSFQGSDKSQHASTSSVPRPLVGGIRFLVQLKDEDHGDTSLFTLTTETLRFQAITGQSTLEISESILNLGRSDELNKVYTHELKITNRTPRLPMHFELRTSSDCLTVDRHEVLLEPGKDDSSFCCIILTVKPKDRGFLNERVEVVNLNNTQQVISLAVRLFISPGQLRCSSTSNDEEIHKILWHDVYLMQKTKDVESPEFVLSPDEHQETKSLLVQNVTDELIEIYPKSDLPLDLRWTLHYESGFVMDSHPSHSQDHASGLGLGLTCGPLVMVHPGKSVVAHVSVPCPRVSPDEVTSTSLIKLDGYLSLESEKGFALEQMEISASYCESIAVLDRLSVDLGNIGHLNSWNPVSFDFTLTNISEVLFIYSMKCPKGISIDLEDRLEGQIGILKSSTLTATLHPKLLDDLTPGVKTLVLEIVNTKNSRNRLEVSVVVAVSLPEVRFDRLDQDGIYLPLVPYPALSGSGFSEFTFVIQNLSDQEKKIQIAPALLPEAEEILDISLTTKFGATPTNSAVSLPPSSFLDVRVRGSVKERFSMDNSDSRASWFTSAERHRFGAVMVYTKDTSASSQWESDLHIVDSIPVSGFFVEEQVFSLSRKHIQFQSFSDWEQDRNGVDPRDSKQSDSITITNFSLSQPLEFRVQLEFPVDKGMGLSKLRIHPLDDGMVGVIPPSQSFDIMVELLDSCITGLSEDIKILVFNARSLFAKPQTVTVNIEDIPTPKVGTPIEHIIDHFPPAATLLLEDGSLELSARLTKLDESWRSDSDSQISAPRSAITDASLSESHSGANYPPRLGQPVISLKGCKRISEDGGIPGAGGLFLLDLAQQDLGSNSVTRKLMLENSSPEKMSYRLRVLGGDAPWMTLSRSDGCFDGHGLVSLNDKESQSITLSFSTTVRGVFLAYIVMENVTFPADNKILKIQLEVVAPRNLRRSISGPGNASRGSDLPVNNHVFDVYVSGISNEVEVMDFDNLYFDSSYSGRSLVIHNRESGPLEFVVKGTLAEDAEFLFSLSRSTAKLFRSLIIDGESSMRIYVHFRPPRSWLVSQKQPEEMSLEEADIPTKKSAEIMVTCRLVKDYSKVIQVNAYCRQPQMKIFNTTFLFSGAIQKKEQNTLEVPDKIQWSADFNSVKNEFIITNVLKDPLEYLIVNETFYFTVENSDASGALAGSSFSNGWILEPGQSHRIHIMPKMEAILKHADFLRKERYVLEYLTVYNKRRPKENYWISLKLCLGHLSQFQYASGSRSSFDGLEISISIFLNDAQAVPSSFLLGDLGQNAKLDELYFRYNYIVDQLIHNGTREHGENYLQLATLLFTVFFSGPMFKSLQDASGTVLGSKKWPPTLARWIQSFFSFMSYFPHRLGRMGALRDLASELLGTTSSSPAMMTSSAFSGFPAGNF